MSDTKRPLWELMQAAAAHNSIDPGIPDNGPEDYALMIEAVAAHLVPPGTRPNQLYCAAYIDSILRLEANKARRAS
jgi:hypothetical protein